MISVNGSRSQSSASARRWAAGISGTSVLPGATVVAVVGPVPRYRCSAVRPILRQGGGVTGDRGAGRHLRGAGPVGVEPQGEFGVRVVHDVLPGQDLVAAAVPEVPPIPAWHLGSHGPAPGVLARRELR